MESIDPTNLPPPAGVTAATDPTATRSRTEQFKAKAGEYAHDAAEKAKVYGREAGDKLQHELKEQWHRVREQSPEFVYPSVADAAAHNARRTEANLAYYRDNPAGITRRLAELDDEWDSRRVLQVATSGLGLAGFWFSFTKSRLWTLLPMAMSVGALHHGLTNGSPAEDLVRRLGFRTRNEIDYEKRALMDLHADRMLAATPADLTAPQMG